MRTSAGCSSQTLPTRWWRRAAEPGSCLPLHQSRSCAETPAAGGAANPPPAAESCRLRSSRLHSGASAAKQGAPAAIMQCKRAGPHFPQVLAGSKTDQLFKYFSEGKFHRIFHECLEKQERLRTCLRLIRTQQDQLAVHMPVINVRTSFSSSRH